MLRSVVVPGWGSLAAGDVRGLAVLAVAFAGSAALLLLGLPYADGTAVALVFLAGAMLAIGWAAQALVAWRRAVRRRQAFDLPTADGSALAVLWLAPVAIVAATVFWSLSGAGASPGARAATYVGAWWADSPARAAMGFAPPIDPAQLQAAWDRQEPRLRNALVAAAAEGGPGGGIDPERPFESIRFTEEPTAGGGGARNGGDDTRTVRMEIVRRVLVSDTVLGFVRTRSQRLESVADIGRIELRLERTPGPLEVLPPVESWRIVRVEALGESIGG